MVMSKAASEAYCSAKKQRPIFGEIGGWVGTPQLSLRYLSFWSALIVVIHLYLDTPYGQEEAVSEA